MFAAAVASNTGLAPNAPSKPLVSEIATSSPPPVAEEPPFRVQ
ncbi:MAG TPA: hypothetical protein VHE30_27220 [Polyangiaceae bacterium]|nr:hypothetical protein [Polyangiaceae bacterium]